MSKDEQIAAPPKYRVLPYGVREYYTNVGTPHEPKIETHRYILSHVDNKGHHIAFDPAWVEWAEKNGVHDTDYAVAKIRTRLLQKDYRLIGTPEIHTLLNAIEDRDETIAKLTAERDAAAAKGEQLGISKCIAVVKSHSPYSTDRGMCNALIEEFNAIADDVTADAIARGEGGA